MTPPGSGRLVGRDAELAALEACVSRASGGRSTLAVVEGEAGTGKTALLQELVSRCAGRARALHASGEEGEQRLDLGVVEQLVEAAAVIGCAVEPIGRDGTRPDPLVVGAALLEVLRAASGAGPVVVVVDDAQWADQPSAQALTYALRRLRHEPVCTVVGQRPGAAALEPLRRVLNDRQGTHVRLGGLCVADVRALVAARRGLPLSSRAAQRLVDHTRGNPLQVVAVADELDADELTSGLGPVPAPRSYATLMLNKLATCSPSVESLVTAVAVAGGPVAVERLPPLLEVRTSSDGDAWIDEALVAGVERGLLQSDVRAGRAVVDVKHPLLRSAILDDLPPLQRAEHHRRAAAVATDPIRRMRHRLAGTLGQDTEVGRAAVELARERLRLGWELSAVELLDAATDRFPPGPDRDAAVLLTVDSLLAVGDLAAAAEHLALLEPDADRAEEQLLRGQLAFLSGRSRAAHAALRHAWATSDDPDLRARAAMLLATLATNLARPDRARHWARLALERTGPHTVQALTMIASSWALDGDLGAGRSELRTWTERSTDAGSDALPPDALLPDALLALWDGDLHDALATLDRAVDLGLDRGTSLTAATIRYTLADTTFRLGDWDRAGAVAEQLAVTLDDAELALASPMAHGVAAFVRAGRGDFAEAEAHLRAGHRALDATGNVAGLLWQAVATARVAEARADHESVISTLAPLAALMAAVPVSEGVQPWWSTLVDAHVAVGNLDDAAAAMSALDARLGDGGPHARTCAARSRGVFLAATGEDDAAAAAFAAGLAEDAAAAGPFVRGRLELEAGGFHRRRGRRRDAAELLTVARDRFERLGAAPYLARAERELDSCGLRPRRRGTPTAALTPAEESVAALVAQGLTNREVAAELFVSVKTVESHLGRVFSKLGVRSRAALAARWVEVDEAEDQGSP